MKEIIETKWGRWYVTAEGVGWKTKILEIDPDQMISLQYHNKRSENWVIIQGHGMLLIEEGSGERYVFSIGETDHYWIDKGSLHQVKNTGRIPLIIAETQLGICEEEDIVRLDEKGLEDII